MKLKELEQARAAALKAAGDIVAKAQSEDRDLTPEEITEVEAKHAEIDGEDGLDAKIATAKKSADLMNRTKSHQPAEEPDDDDPETKAAPGSLGDRFVKSGAFKAWRDDHPSGVSNGSPVRIEAKGVGGVADLGIGRKATITTETGQPVPQREPGYRDLLPPDEPLTFLDLITVGSTDQAYGEYATIVDETDGAAIVAEGALKPLSDIETGKEESKAYTYADGFDITNQTLADDGALAAFMESRIRRHVRGVVERKLFNGTGTGGEPRGIMNTTGTLAQVFDTDVVTTIARALDKFEVANGDTGVQAIVLNSSDIWDLRLLREDGDSGPYLLGNPLQQGPIPTPWGVPIVRSNKLAKGTALVGRFDSVHFLELEALNVLAFNQHKDYAQRNMVYVRAELRGRQLFYAPREVVVADIAA